MTWTLTLLTVTAVLGTLRLRPDPGLRPAGSPIRPVPAAPRRGQRPSSQRPSSQRPSSWRQFGRRQFGQREALASWCDRLAAEVRTGSNLRAAVLTVAPPDGPTWNQVRQRLDRGWGLAAAVDVGSDRGDDHAVLTVLGACGEHGAHGAAPLDQVAATLRRRIADDAERHVQAAQARLSARVMTALPIAVLAVLLLTSSPVRSGVTTPIGLITLTAGMGLSASGWWWMRRIIDDRSASGGPA